ncbi:transcription initiation factor TFIIE subunit beta [Skeletonema marinoi]|uniref:Transcription initiation factor TFIIE subunit beta n=1 Tax=Skeletonema marinoi TaxID=267567 RepID=A0AAD9DE06_9STRA|nr:transcription initiation factor TFIIE subunit beta [Skeletonema marinoi]
MSNVYGLDFLRSEHNLPSSEGDAAATATTSATPAFRRSSSSSIAVIPDVSHKSDLEKQSDVLIFLRQHRSSGCLPPSVIYKSLGIDLSDGGVDSAVANMLANNPKVNVEEVPDPENPSLSIMHYGYRAKFSTVRDRATLLAQINRCKHGVKWSDLTDAYDDVEKDLKKLLAGGEILGVNNPEERDKVLFPRGDHFLVELDGCVTVDLPELPVEPEDKNDLARMEAYKQELLRLKHVRQATSHLIKTDIDHRTQIRRGEAVRVGNVWFRVSSAVREGVSLDNQPPRAQAPPSVVSMKDLSKKNEVDGYVRRFDQNTLPLDGSLSEEVGTANLQSAKKARERLHAIAGGEGGTHRGVSGGASATLLSSVASEKNSSMLAGVFAKSIAASFGMAASRGPGAAGGRKRPTAMIKRPGEGGPGRRGPPGAKGKAAPDADSVKRAVEDAKQAASDPSLSYSHAVRHGCTKDVRDMYLETLDLVPTSEVDLHKVLLEKKLIEPGEKMSRPRMKRKANLDNDGKPKKRRYYERKNMRRTNTHLDGTDIGAMLAEAAERQSQGKEVGDGGM